MASPDELTADHVATLIQSALETDRPPRLSPIGEGGEHHSWWVDDRYVARFAPDEAASLRQRRELALRDLIRTRTDVPLPRSVAHGRWAPGCGFTVDTRLHGTSGERQALSTAGRKQLAALLRALRSIPVADAAALDVPAGQPIEWERLAACAEQARLRLLGTEAVAATPLRPPLQETAPPVLAHADLKGEHLMVRSDGALAGVLDWADAELADPARDVAGLAISVGAPAAAQIAIEAGHTHATALAGVFLARCETLLRLDERLRDASDSPLPLLRAQTARAWQG
ncbi:phosphotransferase family protein [Actinomadura hibisca]|uniref:phosphotransferase family protein n=1 Tax=Actinomadura hibisca TaxID=68565 RepID=UPI00083126DB|nr:aminoglycoside phosphotransferase family protein [Actinomadura hibisca]